MHHPSPTYRRLAATVAVCLVLTVAGCDKPEWDLPDGLYAEISTTKGTIVAALEPDLAPMTTMNFVGLAEGKLETNVRQGKKFYDGLTFHRVEPGFVIQGGDPNGDGSGNPGYRFPTEVTPELKHDAEGVLAMANSGPDTNGCQFYITLAPTPFLDGGYNVFGHVVEGMDVVRAIEAGDVIKEVTILRYGSEAKGYQASDEKFQELIDAEYDRRADQLELHKQDVRDQALAAFPDAVEYENSGLYLATRAAGTGSAPQPGQAVTVHFVWTLVDGTQLDSTRDRGEPFTFTFMTDRLLPGLEMAIGTMPVGARVVALVPPGLAFGDEGRPPRIPAYAYVVFDIERVE